MSFAVVAAATLSSTPLDFEGNLKRILESIRLAREAGATLRTGPELEISGYSCLDHFLERDTFHHSCEVLAKIVENPVCKGMLIDVGMGVRHRNIRYNCRVLCTYRHIYCIRPKMALANDGMYREARYFTAWAKVRQVEDYQLEKVIRDITDQRYVPIGDQILATRDTEVACETCEELFTPLNPSTFSGLDGAEIILNSSASHAEMGRLRERVGLIANSTRKLGGIYIYANATGVDGDARILFDGSSMIIVNGDVVAQGSQFSLLPVEVTVATVDIEQVRSFRTSVSRNVQASQQAQFHRVCAIDLKLLRPADEVYLSNTLRISIPIETKILDPMEEVHYATGVWLWQYLVRSNSAGYFLPLSGGIDSCTVALFVYGMAKLVLTSIQAGETTTLSDLRRVIGDPEFVPGEPQEIVSRLFHTCYMRTKNSTEDTRMRASTLADTIGAYHSDISIDEAIAAHEIIIQKTLHYRPKYTIQGGSNSEDLARQNIQARSRMVVGYGLAQLSTTARGLRRAGVALLVLGAGNCAENLRGYYTKYDASSADISPLGSISKSDVRAFQRWARDNWNLPSLTNIINAKPTPELRPQAAGLQDDESDSEMGMTYEELAEFGILRKVEKLGPWSAYQRLLGAWKDKDMNSPREIAEKVFLFYRYWALNRHKSTILTPSVHLSAYDPDDNRHDLRPFLYNFEWPWQFNKIRENVEKLETMLISQAHQHEQRYTS
ncbi:glutamine-dependent NAD(+) synthetase with GAT domain-containing protein [Melanomma pulvis-pyrius CBS 109.77]|uniref:Glutamine-dependent NAD(+) synthetase n=1 Tax=Melanomma pulvis-pyrius CBS 109.77 TaxID=1314802 RepID=A0A6A6WRK5_9PLEO|nr:glutamine-dependent NAD(+) synthetase with GAT domain-containing protein [Melanomma pulvis-pyrius CBS 109.77]